jgi:D-aspartate ligase
LGLARQMNSKFIPKINSTELPLVVVLDIDFSGYGIVRSLVPYQIPVIAFAPSGKFVPESKTRLCPVIRHRTEEDLLLRLQEFGGLRNKPVLIATIDNYVSMIMHNRKMIESLFHINYPDNHILNLLLSKSLFNDFAVQHQVLIPKSFNLHALDQLPEIIPLLDFPVILKPFIRKPYWSKAGLPKAFFCENEKRLRKSFEQAILVEDQLIIQEWVPGGDKDIYYCLTYFDEQSHCLGAFTGNKIRQWPVGTGSTASTKPADDPFLPEETVRILTLTGYRGFGSIEYKKHAINGKYYLIEPTAGRLNQQEFAATLNGVNLPLIGYCSMTGVNIKQRPGPAEKIIYIDEPAELLSAAVHIKRGLLTPCEWLRSLKGKRRYRYFNSKDIRVFMFLFRKLTVLLVNAVFSRKDIH